MMAAPQPLGLRSRSCSRLTRTEATCILFLSDHNAGMGLVMMGWDGDVTLPGLLMYPGLSCGWRAFRTLLLHNGVLPQQHLRASLISFGCR